MSGLILSGELKILPSVTVALQVDEDILFALAVTRQTKLSDYASVMTFVKSYTHISG